MLSQAQRTAIAELSAKGVSSREMARVLQLSRQTVRTVLRSNSTSVPPIRRAEKAEPYRQRILELLPACKGRNDLIDSQFFESTSEQALNQIALAYFQL